MSLEERLEALMQSYQTVTSLNEEMRSRNEYLQKQLEQSMEQKRRAFDSPSSSTPEDPIEDEGDEVEQPSQTPRREWRIPQSNSNSNDFRIELPEFEGKLDPDEFLDWLQTVERIFDYKEVPEDKKVKLVALKLRKYASLWWTNLCNKRIRERKTKIHSWAKMKSKLKARFLPSSYIQDSYSQLHNLFQGDMNVAEYTREFEKLLIKCDIQEPEEQTIVRYLGGLDPKYSNVIELQQYSTFDEVCVLAHKVEQQKKRQSQKKEFQKPVVRKPVESPENPNPLPGRTVVRQTVPPPVHPAVHSFPPQPQRKPALPPYEYPNQKPRHPQRCFKCQGFGHIAADCTNRRAITLAEWNAVRGDVVKEEEEVQIEPPEEEEEDVIVEPDEGEMLVLRRVCNSNYGENTEQRENIFHSRCTVQEKICSIVIDGGSCANVVSVNMVEKLGLPTSNHPHPYDVHWLNRHKGLRVTSRCLISFSLGKSYQDKMWFDVLPMDVCHLILGRPWLYDRKVMHDGYLNTYSFSKDGKKIILAPLSPSQLPTKSSPKFPHQLNLFLDFDSPPLKVLPTPETSKNFAQKPPPSPRIPVMGTILTNPPLISMLSKGCPRALP